MPDLNNSVGSRGSFSSDRPQRMVQKTTVSLIVHIKYVYLSKLDLDKDEGHVVQTKLL